jgi:hypothetical protein
VVFIMALLLFRSVADRKPSVERARRAPKL